MPSLSSLAKTRRWLSATMRLPICDSNTLWPYVARPLVANKATVMPPRMKMVVRFLPE
jgi:hypothetical protein